ncbi:30s ribosomal s5 [Fusarium sporotrichioides]|uniref:30s ribosomal s5 n=1 Tax=Fusarium sporotrichioides TaxID=5514 RepID=A0A395SE20_FUSSP|nr:30s ribosomal s5 [Fusarium sporotrichioides]
MSVARPARNLLGRCIASSRTASTSITVPAIPCSQFHTSAPRSKRKSRFRNVTAQELGLIKESGEHTSKMEQYKQDKFGELSKKDLENLRASYTAEQLEAIELGEKAVNPEDLIIQGRIRDDPYKPTYIEDYSTLDPRYDIKPEIEGTPREVQWPDKNEWIDNYGERMMKITDKKTSDQLTRAMVRALRRVKESQGEDLIDLTEEELKDIEKDPELIKRYIITEDGPEPTANDKGPEFMTRSQAEKLDEAVDEAWKSELDKIVGFGSQGEVEPTNLELIQDGPAGVDRTYTAEAPDLGKVPGVKGLYKHAVDPEDQGQDDSGKYQEIKRLTGMTLKEIRALLTKGLVTRWVSNQTRLGKVRSTSVVAIAGNGNGRLGLGMAKSTEPGVAEETAQMLAIRNMKPVRRYENRTIYGNVSSKISGTVVELMARPPGFGLRCPHRIFEMCRAAGIHDIAARMPRSKNPMNSVKAAYQALTNQPDPEQIAIGRGKKLVDVRKVYYGGAVY